MAKGCGLVAAVVIGIPLLVAGVVGVKTWAPLREAGQTLEELERSLGSNANFTPAASGEIPPARMGLFLNLRTTLVTACEDYGTVRQGFDSVASLESKDSGDLGDVGEVAKDLGGASLSITPFLARYFEKRNQALMDAAMGLEEYTYIYAVAYHDHLLSAETRNEIFSDGDALSPEASQVLKGCLTRQLEAIKEFGQDIPASHALELELKMMETDPTRLIWQDGVPAVLESSIRPHREQLDQLFCAATAGLEMERTSGRAVRLALE